MEKTLPLEYQGDTESIIYYLYNQFYIEEDDYNFEKIIYHYFKNGALLLKVGILVIPLENTI